ncbi:SCP2 sterol-binding domain-containing protein [Acinetobacter puyangensis]|uniref:SCP2 sterol-binding domain-containing protein n=1 Tax=Acinetobacter puyangensis TaxID=1096779 RepID=UPI003A4D81F6
MGNLIDTLNGMKQRFNVEAAQGVEEIFQLNTDEGEHFYVTIDNDQCSVEQGESDTASVTLNISNEILTLIMEGPIEGIQAFMQGKLKVTGNIMLAAKLGELFPGN